MSIEPLACPYCNALVPAAAAGGPRILCPRCGEAFTVRESAPISLPDRSQAAGSGGAAVAALERPVDRSPRTRRNNRIVAATMLGAMIVVAAITLAFALYTQPDRRDHDQPPMQEALHWLPPDTSVIAGVRVAELNRTEQGRDLLNHLFHVGPVEVNADLLQRWTGLKLEEIDVVALGVRADDGLVPRTVLVVRTLRPYDADALKKALGAEPAAGTSGKSLFRCKPQEAGLRPIVWFADARTLVFGLLEKHLDAVPDQAPPNLDALPSAVQEVLNQRVDVGAPAWIVGYSKDWRNTAAGFLLGHLPERDADLLGRVHSFAVQADLDPPGLTLAFKCDSDEAAEALETRLATAKPAGVNGKAERTGPWLTWQLRGDPITLIKDLGK